MEKKQNRKMPGYVRARLLLGSVIIGLLVFGLGVQYNAYIVGIRPGTAEAANIVAAADFDAAHNEGDVIISLDGEVAHRGYYAVSADTELRDIIKFAGVKAGGDISDFDMAHKPQHGDEYHIRSKDDPLDVTPWLNNTYQPQAGDGESGALVNLNTATLEELQTLPRIGEVRAQAIIDYRLQHNGFRYKEELLGVDGIGQKIYEELVDKVEV